MTRHPEAGSERLRPGLVQVRRVTSRPRTRQPASRARATARPEVPSIPGPGQVAAPMRYRPGTELA
jgi:hypothetical protein